MTKASVIHQQSKMSNMGIIKKMLMRKLNAQTKVYNNKVYNIRENYA